MPEPAVVGPDGDVQISGTKSLTGRDLSEGEFTFQLLSGSRHCADHYCGGSCADAPEKAQIGCGEIFYNLNTIRKGGQVRKHALLF